MSQPTLDETLAQVSPQVLLDLMRQLMEDALARVKGGEMPDLAPIERGVAALCDKIARMTPEEGRQFRDGLTSVMTQLGEVGAALKGQQASLAQELGQMGLHQKANAAYRTSTHLTPQVKEGEKDEK